LDILTLIKRDHDDVKALFDEFQGLGERATVSRAKLAKKIMDELKAHDHAEEQTLYTPTRERVRDTEERTKVLEAFEEHAVAADVIQKLEKLDVSDETYVPKMEVLIEAVRHHIKEEEGRVHKIVRQLFEADELKTMAPAFEEAKERELAHA
jgi:hemerythrin-like domain-containing protein